MLVGKLGENWVDLELTPKNGADATPLDPSGGRLTIVRLLMPVQATRTRN